MKTLDGRSWNDRQHVQKAIDELARKYAPKQTTEYTENGVIVKVYEARNGGEI